MSGAWLWADGGESACAPANTMQAYWGALGAGCDGIALTVQTSKNGALVCVSGETLSATTGVDQPVAALTSQEIRALDAGAGFRSRALDARNRVVGEPGRDTPWQGHQHDAVFHPELDEVLLHLGRRTRFLIVIRPAKDASQAEVRKLAGDVIALLERHAVRGRCILAGGLAVVDAIGKRHHRVCLDPDPRASLTQAVEQAERANVPLVLADVRTADEPDALRTQNVSVIVRPGIEQGAIDPELYSALSGRPWVAGYRAMAVQEMHALLHTRGLVLRDEFGGNRVDSRLWTLGHSRSNQDASIEVADGLRIEVVGAEYSGAAAFTNFSIHGDFDARVSFDVLNPQQGTTFELAALHVDAGYRPRNLTFDVHGAPPYASSERDENDGFRIGWNNGPALTRWIENEPQSSNLYNCYGRDVGYAGADSPSGRLRLTRCGYIYNAYYTDRFNDGWVLSGSTPVPALAAAVFLRLGAKHWRKAGAPPPTNRFRFFDFELYQWD